MRGEHSSEAVDCDLYSATMIFSSYCKGRNIAIMSGVKSQVL